MSFQLGDEVLDTSDSWVRGVLHQNIIVFIQVLYENRQFSSEVSYSKILWHESTQQHIHKFQFFYLVIIYSQISEIREIFEKTRLHSRRMHTAHLLTTSQHALCKRVSAKGGIYPGGCLPRGCLPRGYLPRGVSAQGGVCPGGGCLPGGCLPRLPPVNRITDTCKNITLSQLHCGW